MRVRVGIRHNLVGQAGFRPGVGDLAAHARRLRPNASEAAALFTSDWQGREFPGAAESVLAITVMMDHAGMRPPSRRLVRLRDGWAAVIHLTRELLMAGARELPIGEIADAIEDQAQQILARVAAQELPPDEGARGREARR